MNSFKLSLISAAIAIAFFASANHAFASLEIVSNDEIPSQPQFTSCLTPSGSVVADYKDGDHGIVGQGAKNGQDTVYLVGNNNYMQCFCGNGSGIQTNWMYASNLTGDQIKVYENQGWIYVPDGSAWGLTEGSYLAKNISYSCGGSSTTGGGQGQEPNNPNDGKSDGRSDGASIVQSATGTSGFASTGNIVFLLSILGAGILFTLTGILLRKNSK